MNGMYQEYIVKNPKSVLGNLVEYLVIFGFKSPNQVTVNFTTCYVIYFQSCSAKYTALTACLRV